MAFFKHVGEHNGKKVIIVQRSIPGEAHLAAVIYSQIIPSQYHDDIMSVLQSEEGQQSREFMDIMNRRMLRNGGNMLVTCVNEGFVKKAQAAQIIVKPNASSSIRLDELNKLLTMAGEGQEAIKKLEELDVEDIEPIGHITGMQDVFRSDEESDFGSIGKEDILKNAPDRKDGYVKVKSVL